MIVKKKAYAKINLTLEILGTKRGDGFHDIASVMMKVKNLYDDVEVSLKSHCGITLSCNKEVCPEKENIAYIAAEKYIALYEKKYGKSFGADIHLTKRIPMGAGLAGGSSNAAAVIDALSELTGGLTDEEIHKIATEVGSDVPFCLECHNVALCENRGDIITDLADIENAQIKVIIPETPLFTKSIYAEYDRENGNNYTKDKSIRMAELINKKADISEIAPLMCNDFQSICEKRCPGINEAVMQLKADGYYSQMSGTGSAVFGIRKAPSLS